MAIFAHQITNTAMHHITFLAASGSPHIWAIFAGAIQGIFDSYLQKLWPKFAEIEQRQDSKEKVTI